MLDVRRLQVLREVARQGSLSAAARELDYTQPAVSHHIARLEDEVGTPLLVRAGRGVRLTEAGAALAAHADDLLARMSAAEDDVAAIAGLRAGRVRLAAFPSATATIVPPAVAALRAAHPGVGVSFVEQEPPEALAALRAGELDLAVAFAYPEAPDGDQPWLEHVELFSDPLLAVLPAGHRRARARRLKLADLAGETWIAGCERCRRHLLHACAEAGFKPDIAFATDDYVAVQSLVVAGVGVALLPSLGLRAVQNPGVAVVALAAEHARAVFAAVPRAERHPPAVAAMLAALREASMNS
jgi:molybdate transport repressor ModE-like protein